MKKGWITKLCCICLLLLTNICCYSIVDTTVLYAIQDIQSLTDSLLLDRKYYTELQRHAYLEKVQKAEDYINQPLSAIQMNIINDIAADSSLHKGNREKTIRDRAILLQKVIPVYVHADTILHEKFNQEATIEAIKDLERYQNNLLLIKDQRESIRNMVSILQAYKTENAKFIKVFNIEGKAKSKYEFLCSQENNASWLINAYVSELLIPFLKNSTDFYSFKYTTVPYLNTLFIQMEEELEYLSKDDNADTEQLKLFFDCKNELQ